MWVSKPVKEWKMERRKRSEKEMVFSWFLFDCLTLFLPFFAAMLLSQCHAFCHCVHNDAHVVDWLGVLSVLTLGVMIAEQKA